MTERISMLAKLDRGGYSAIVTEKDVTGVGSPNTQGEQAATRLFFCSSMPSCAFNGGLGGGALRLAGFLVCRSSNLVQFRHPHPSVRGGLTATTEDIMPGITQSKSKKRSNVHHLELVPQQQPQRPSRFLDYVSQEELQTLTQIRMGNSGLAKLILAYKTLDLEEQEILVEFAIVRATKELARKRSAPVVGLVTSGGKKVKPRGRNDESRQ